MVPACIARCSATGPRTIAGKKVKPADDQNDYYGEETDEETAPGSAGDESLCREGIGNGQHRDDDEEPTDSWYSVPAESGGSYASSPYSR